MPPDPEREGWTEWSMYVLKELERLSASVLESHTKIRELETTQTRLEERWEARGKQNIPERVDALEEQVLRVQLKAGFWGAVGAALPIIAAYIMWRFKAI